MKSIHIVPGESFKKILSKKLKKENIKGLHKEIVPFNEALIRGKISEPLFNDEFINLRCGELGVSRSVYVKRISKFVKFLQNANDYDEVLLWFGAEPFCQANLSGVLKCLKQVLFKGKIIVNLVNELTGEIIESKTAKIE